MKKIIVILIMSLTFISFGQEESKKASPFRLESVSGEFFELDSLVSGGPVVLNFWASWCKPCKEELPEFARLSEEYKDKGLKVILVTIDKPSQVQKARNFLKTKGIELELLKDCSMSAYKSFGGSGSVPYTFIVDKDRNIVFRKKGQISYKEISDEVSKLLK